MKLNLEMNCETAIGIILTIYGLYCVIMFFCGLDDVSKTDDYKAVFWSVIHFILCIIISILLYFGGFWQQNEHIKYSLKTILGNSGQFKL